MTRGSELHTTYENEGSVEIFVVFLDVVSVVLGRLLLVHRVEVEASIVVLDRLEERSECILEATSFQRSTTHAI